MPTSSRFRRFWHRVLTWSGPLLLLLCMVYKLIEWISERWWFESLGYQSQYDALIAWRFGSFVLGAALLGAWLGCNAHLAWTVAARAHVPLSFFEAPASDRLIPLEDKLQLDRYRRRVTLLLVGSLSWLGGLAFAAHYGLFLRAYYGGSTGHTDAASNFDLAFFLFQLPLWSWIHRFCLGAIVAALLLVVAIYLYEETIAPPGRTPRVAEGAAKHLAGLWALLLLWKGADCLMRVPVGFVTSGNVASRIFDTSDIRYGWTSAALFALCTPLVVALSVSAIATRPRWKTLLWGSGWIFCATAIPFVLPMVFQPPANDPMWAEALQRHIKSTRAAWALDEVDEQRINLGADPRFGQSTSYFSPSLAVWPTASVRNLLNSREKTKTSDLRVVATSLQRGNEELHYLSVLAPLAPNTEDWFTNHSRSANGEVVKAIANRVGEDKQLQCDPPLKTPVLFGPGGRGDENSEGQTDGDDSFSSASRPDTATWALCAKAEDQALGVSLQNALVRTVLAARFADSQLATFQFPAGEKLLWHRSAAERCRQVAPFLGWYADEARPVVVQPDETEPARLFWLVPGLVWSDDYPDSATPAIPGTAPPGANYSRQIAVGVVDGRSGRVQLFSLDDDEPFMALYKRAFPGLFSPLTSLALALQKEIRPSPSLLNAQTLIWGRYHQDDSVQWQQRSDDWRPLLSPDEEDGSMARPMAAQSSGEWQIVAYSPLGGQIGSNSSTSNLVALLGADERNFVSRHGRLRFVQWSSGESLPLTDLISEPPVPSVDGRVRLPSPVQIGMAPLFDAHNRASGIIAIKGQIEDNGDSDSKSDNAIRLDATASMLVGPRAIISVPPFQVSPSSNAQHQLDAARRAWRDLLAARRLGEWESLALAEKQLAKALTAPSS